VASVSQRRGRRDAAEPAPRWLGQRAPQVRYSARILFQELVARRGYAGGYDTVKNAEPTEPLAPPPAHEEVEVRDLAIYEQMLEAA
jgi:hypothetical protein